MTRMTSNRNRTRLPPRDPKGGRPPQDIAAQLGIHILNIALKQFVAHGVERTSMEGIAAAANVSKRTLYTRFGSKTALLLAAVEHGVTCHLTPIATTIPAGTTREKLLYAGRKMLDSSLKREVIGIESLVMWIVDHDLDLSGVTAPLGAQAAINMIRSILEDAPETRASDSADLEFLAMLIFDAMLTIPRTRILVRRELPNTPRAKADYLSRTIDFIFSRLPLHDSSGSG